MRCGGKCCGGAEYLNGAEEGGGPADPRAQSDGQWDLGRMDGCDAGSEDGSVGGWYGPIGARGFWGTESLRLRVPAHGNEGKFRGAPGASRVGR
jgi:hypothetical protein